MMIDKRLINTVPQSKKWIFITILWNWLTLFSSIGSAIIFSYILQQAYYQQLDLSRTILLSAILIALISSRVFTSKKAVKSSYYASAKVKHHLRELIYQKLASMPLSQVQQQSTSSIIQVASEGVEQLEIYFGRYLPQLFYSLLAPLTLFSILIFFNAPTALILLLCVPLIPMSIIAVNKIAKRLLAKYWAIYTGLGSSFLDNLQGLITLKIYQDDQHKAEAMDEEAEHFRKITMKVLTMQLNSVSIMDLLAYGGAAVGIITALYQFQAGNVSILGVILFILLSSEFFIPLRLLGSFFHIAMNGKAASDKIFALLDTPVVENAGTEAFNFTQNIDIQVKDLSFSYNNDEKLALNHLNLSIQPNQLTVFVGKSGCGKSTLVSLLMGFYTAQKGEVLYKDHLLQDFSRESFYDHISLVSHRSYIFKGSLRENMLMAKGDASDAEIYNVLEKVNLAQFVRENDGLNMPLLTNASNLSGGQIQRLALARALLRDSEVYIFDEATSNIDIESEKIILQLIQELKQSKTIVMISHRLANAVDADKIYVLNQGHLAEQGTHQELMQQQGLYNEMFNQQHSLEQIRKGDHNA